ncbi:phage tail protein [Winslowiella arboricola]|uniref:phage tail protein n=1 Tax=Winslowiella arboricola TaxID=2978220 RepID=UPI00225E0E5E|nr:phage tail protein [Winslowiella arboricola]MCU5775862.1 phage tail protein [Winslowiella arboricola]
MTGRNGGETVTAKKFSAVLTAAGAARLTAAALSGVPVGFSQMAVGDANGVLPVPDPQQTGLINERYRAPLNRLSVADQGASIIEAELIMPPQVGGFWLREVALFSEDNVCLAVANMPESYKPQLAQGAGRHQAIRIWLGVSSTADVQFIDNPAVVLATIDEVNRIKSEAQDYTDEIAGNLDDAMKSAIADAVKGALRDAWEDDNPVGEVRLFKDNVDPNARWPWSEWKYLGEDKTIRLGKQDGSDVMATGGSDSIRLARNNLPAEQINVTGETSSHDFGTLNTEDGGAHDHEYDQWGTGGTAARFSLDDVWFGNKKARTAAAAAHKHAMKIPAHKHTVTAKTEQLGEGREISVVNSYIRLMAWYRSA